MFYDAEEKKLSEIRRDTKLDGNPREVSSSADFQIIMLLLRIGRRFIYLRRCTDEETKIVFNTKDKRLKKRNKTNEFTNTWENHRWR